MTKKQANTLMALGVALILTQILCTGLILRGQERTRKEAAAAQLSAEDTLEMQKQAASRPSLKASDECDACNDDVETGLIAPTSAEQTQQSSTDTVLKLRWVKVMHNAGDYLRQQAEIEQSRAQLAEVQAKLQRKRRRNNKRVHLMSGRNTGAISESGVRWYASTDGGTTAGGLLAADR